MTDSILPFTYESQTVRVIEIDGEPWFVLTDLCKVLDLHNITDVKGRLDDGVGQTYPIIDSLGRIQQATIVSEPGMYEVVIRSDKAEAVAFRRWITSEVLPSIRKTGSYGTPALPDLTSLEGISAILDAGKAALNHAQAAERRAAELEGPAAERDLYRSSAGLQLIGDVANRFKAYAADRWPDLKVKHEDVWAHAGRLGIIIRGNTVRNNQPTAAAIENGWAKPSETVYETKTHGTKRTVTTRLTTKGETRLWDGLVAYVNTNDTLTITKEIAA